MESVSPWIAGLCESVDGHPEAGVLPHQPGGVLLREERVHEDKGHIRVVGPVHLLCHHHDGCLHQPVQVLQLLHGQVKGGEVVPHRNCACWPAAVSEYEKVITFSS